MGRMLCGGEVRERGRKNGVGGGRNKRGGGGGGGERSEGGLGKASRLDHLK